MKSTLNVLLGRVVVSTMLACMMLPCNANAQQPLDQILALPFRSSVVPIASDLWIDRYRVAVSVVKFGNSVEEIASYFERNALRHEPGSGILPTLVKRFDGGVLISWWQAAKLVTLHLRSAPDETLLAASSGLLVVSPDIGTGKPALDRQSESCSLAEHVLPDEAILLRTVGSQDGALLGCVTLARIGHPLPLAWQKVYQQLKRNHYSISGLPNISTDQYRFQYFQKDQIRLSLAIHARADESLLMIQTSSNLRPLRSAPTTQR